jgi:hypothetical protein
MASSASLITPAVRRLHDETDRPTSTMPWNFSGLGAAPCHVPCVRDIAEARLIPASVGYSKAGNIPLSLAEASDDGNIRD